MADAVQFTPEMEKAFKDRNMKALAGFVRQAHSDRDYTGVSDRDLLKSWAHDPNVMSKITAIRSGKSLSGPPPAVPNSSFASTITKAAGAVVDQLKHTGREVESAALSGAADIDKTLANVADYSGLPKTWNSKVSAPLRQLASDTEKNAASVKPKDEQFLDPLYRGLTEGIIQAAKFAPAMAAGPFAPFVMAGIGAASEADKGFWNAVAGGVSAGVMGQYLGIVNKIPGLKRALVAAGPSATAALFNGISSGKPSKEIAQDVVAAGGTMAGLSSMDGATKLIDEFKTTVKNAGKSVAKTAGKAVNAVAGVEPPPTLRPRAELLEPAPPEKTKGQVQKEVISKHEETKAAADSARERMGYLETSAKESAAEQKRLEGDLFKIENQPTAHTEAEKKQLEELRKQVEAQKTHAAGRAEALKKAREEVKSADEAHEAVKEEAKTKSVPIPRKNTPVEQREDMGYRKAPEEVASPTLNQQAPPVDLKTKQEAERKQARPANSDVGPATKPAPHATGLAADKEYTPTGDFAKMTGVKSGTKVTYTGRDSVGQPTFKTEDGQEVKLPNGTTEAMLQRMMGVSRPSPQGPGFALTGLTPKRFYKTSGTFRLPLDFYKQNPDIPTIKPGTAVRYMGRNAAGEPQFEIAHPSGTGTFTVTMPKGLSDHALETMVEKTPSKSAAEKGAAPTPPEAQGETPEKPANRGLGLGSGEETPATPETPPVTPTPEPRPAPNVTQPTPEPPAEEPPPAAASAGNQPEAEQPKPDTQVTETTKTIKPKPEDIEMPNDWINNQMEAFKIPEDKKPEVRRLYSEYQKGKAARAQFIKDHPDLGHNTRAWPADKAEEFSKITKAERGAADAYREEFNKHAVDPEEIHFTNVEGEKTTFKKTDKGYVPKPESPKPAAPALPTELPSPVPPAPAEAAKPEAPKPPVETPAPAVSEPASPAAPAKPEATPEQIAEVERLRKENEELKKAKPAAQYTEPPVTPPKPAKKKAGPKTAKPKAATPSQPEVNPEQIAEVERLRKENEVLLAWQFSAKPQQATMESVASGIAHAKKMNAKKAVMVPLDENGRPIRSKNDAGEPMVPSREFNPSTITRDGIEEIARHMEEHSAKQIRVETPGGKFTTKIEAREPAEAKHVDAVNGKATPPPQTQAEDEAGPQLETGGKYKINGEDTVFTYDGKGVDEDGDPVHRVTLASTGEQETLTPEQFKSLTADGIEKADEPPAAQKKSEQKFVEPEAPTDKPKPTRLRAKGSQIPPATGKGGTTSNEARVGGKIKLGADVKSLGKVLGSSLYTGQEAHVITKELLQNAIDAIRGRADGEATVDVDRYDRKITITDNGKGMSPKEIGTVFTDLGASGKRDQANASGGFGLAKAAPLMMSEKITVESVADVRGKRIRSTFTATPDQLLNEGVNLQEEEVGKDTPTGTKIVSVLPYESQGWYDAGYFVEGFKKSIDMPGKLTLKGDLARETEATKPRDLRHLATIRVPGANLDIHASYERKGLQHQMGTVTVEINNHGIYQFDKSIWLGGSAAMKDVPATIAVNVKANVEEGDPHYPFSANREELRSGEVLEKITEYVKENIVKPAIEKANKFLEDKYNSLPTMRSDFNIPVFDSGARLTEQEAADLQNNHDLVNLGEHISVLVDQAVAKLMDSPKLPSNLKKLGENIEHAGFVLSKELHGVHITNQSTNKSTVFVNPFSYSGEYHEAAATPGEAAANVWHTIKHEILHDKIPGHNQNFTSGEAQVSRVLGDLEVQALLRLRSAYAKPGNNEEFREGINRALQIYRESRGREVRETDPFRGEELGKRDHGPGRKQGNVRPVQRGREKSVPRNSEPPEARE